MAFDRQVSKGVPLATRMMIGDILDVAVVADAISGSDVVFNFAGIADIAECIEKPIEAVTTNVLGTTNLLQACAEANVGRFVF